MLTVFAGILLAQSMPSATPQPPQVVIQPQQVRPLPGGLDDVLVFNSNSPEVVQNAGILLSTFPTQGMQVPTAHLNLPLQGRFDLFLHHIARAATPVDPKTLYIGVILYNPGSKPVTVSVLQAASYLSQPDAPFVSLPSQSDNAAGTVFAGPGDRAMLSVLQGIRQPGWPAQIVIPPRQSQMLMNLPIPVRGLIPPLNGRSTLIRVRSTGPVYAASLGLFSTMSPEGRDRPPNLEDWQALLKTSGLSTPRDIPGTPPGTTGKFAYGRVAGVAKGSRWLAQITDPVQDSKTSSKSQLANPTSKLQIPAPGQAFSYVLSTVERGTFGTKQVQSAPLLVRYPDTAFQAHGNYGIEYNLSLPLFNPARQPQTVTVTLQTPIKSDQATGGLSFNQPPPARVFFRGTVRVRYTDDQGVAQTRFIHLVQQQGQMADPLVKLSLPPGQQRSVDVQFLYPPDATPPQVLTVRTLSN
jgi:hypothetical protein